MKEYEILKDNLKQMGSLVIAFSGGVDSTFLLKVAHDVLGDKVLAVTATSSTYPQRELTEAIALAAQIGAEQMIIRSEELEIEGFSKNPENRCYYCKFELFDKIAEIAKSKGIPYIADGSNADDINDFRPGMQGMRAHGAISPLMQAGLTKEMIRTLSKELGLPTWTKPAFACLSSRIPYGESITQEKLSMIDAAENLLLSLGFVQVRVRHHENTARIEVGSAERKKFFDLDLMDKIDAALKKIGYTYVSLDLRGYRTGSMNEVLKL